MLMPVLEFIKDVGPVVTAIGVFVAVWTLRANHDWLGTSIPLH
jgi:hypothetical protein